MTETVEVGQFGDGFDPATGESTLELVESRYVGKARVKYPSYAVAEQSPASQPIAQQDVVVSLPAGSGPVFEGDMVRVVASSADGSIVGRMFRVKGQPVGGQTTAYRLTVTETS